jgi:hypothetical protein
LFSQFLLLNEICGSNQLTRGSISLILKSLKFNATLSTPNVTLGLEFKTIWSLACHNSSYKILWATYKSSFIVFDIKNLVPEFRTWVVQIWLKLNGGAIVTIVNNNFPTNPSIHYRISYLKYSFFFCILSGKPDLIFPYTETSG